MVKRATWVCGAERVLVEEVVDFIRTALQPSDLDVVLMVAGKAKDREIYASLNQYPAEGKRLLVVRDAEKIKRWEPFADWQQESRLMPSSYVVFVSGESDFDTERPVHRLIVDKNGSMIRCAPPPDEVAVQWIQKRHEMHSEVTVNQTKNSTPAMDHLYVVRLCMRVQQPNHELRHYLRLRDISWSLPSGYGTVHLSHGIQTRLQQTKRLRILRLR